MIHVETNLSEGAMVAMVTASAHPRVLLEQNCRLAEMVAELNRDVAKLEAENRDLKRCLEGDE